VEGQLCRRTKVLFQPEQWKVFIPDHHEEVVPEDVDNLSLTKQ
jgi:hypothetical protein